MRSRDLIVAALLCGTLALGSGSAGRAAAPGANLVDIDLNARIGSSFFPSLNGNGFVPARPYSIPKGSAVELKPRHLNLLHLKAHSTVAPMIRTVSVRVDAVTWSRYWSGSQAILLRGTITKTQWPQRCAKGQSFVLELAKGGRAPGPSSVCGTAKRAVGTFDLDGGLAPSWFSLRVNRTDFKHPWLGYQQVPNTLHPTPNTTLELAAETDVPLPPGWKLVILRTGDPLSPGNGKYYEACTLKVGKRVCGPVSRPGLDKGVVELVSATLFDPQGGWQEQGARIEWGG